MTHPTSPELLSDVRKVTECPEGQFVERVQSLWSGYGAIYRFATGKRAPSSYIVKHVCPPSARNHPRGWSSDTGHERKLRSYEVERVWYAERAAKCGDSCRVPRARHVSAGEGAWLFVLEDLDDAGFGLRRSSLTDQQMRACLSWLAHFHATFLGTDPSGLWETGTYWHLDTRPDELLVMKEEALRRAAPLIDSRLQGARFQTLVHGDAKVANFCFAGSRSEVAAVDFQYVGGGVGVKDVAYFLSSCLDESECLRAADGWVDVYFQLLEEAVSEHCPHVPFSALEAEWRSLYPFAWADFLRFLVGWAPDHFKIHGYSRRLTDLVLQGLGQS